MAVERERERDRAVIDAFEPNWSWKGGAIAGLLATIAMGAVISVTNSERCGSRSPGSTGSKAVSSLAGPLI